ncbi:MAG: hypothetical protein U1F27_17015 [Turneriella sp.]
MLRGFAVISKTGRPDARGDGKRHQPMNGIFAGAGAKNQIRNIREKTNRLEQLFPRTDGKKWHRGKTDFIGFIQVSREKSTSALLRIWS